MMRATLFGLSFVLFLPLSAFAENLTIASWNIENLGGSGRGFVEVKGVWNLFVIRNLCLELPQYQFPVVVQTLVE